MLITLHTRSVKVKITLSSRRFSAPALAG